MTILEVFNVQSNAKRDARAGVESCDEVVHSQLGVRPEFDPSKVDHKRIQDDLDLDPEIKAKEDELKDLEDRRAHEPFLLPINVALAGCYIGEAFGCVLLMKSYGFENPEKTIFGALLAGGIFAVTSIASRATGRGRFIAYAVYAALVLAIAGSRIADQAAEGASWGEAIVLVFLTIGPAALAEWLWRRREVVAKLAKQMKNVCRRLAELRDRRNRAQRFVDKLMMAQRAWDNSATVVRSTYTKDHRRHSALSGPTWHPRGTVGTN